MISVTRLAMLVGVLLALAVSLSFGAAQWVESGAIDSVATAVLGLLFLSVWSGLILFMTRCW